MDLSSPDGIFGISCRWRATPDRYDDCCNIHTVYMICYGCLVGPGDVRVNQM